MSSDACFICERVAWWRAGENPYVIHEFPETVFVVGDHQFHRGYALLLLKNHVRELHELPPPRQAAMFAEVMLAGRALAAAFEPWKMNYACYGNTDEHVHWHLFPRYAHDPDRRSNPWLHAPSFKEHLIDHAAARALADRIRSHLAPILGGAA